MIIRSLKFSILSLFSLLLFSCAGTRKIEKNAYQSFNNSPAFKQAFVGFMLYDPESGKTLIEHNAHKYHTPASNTKLFTLYTGLKILGDSLPALKYTIKNDSLYFTGTADPSFLNPYLGESRVLEFLKNKPENLVYLPPNFTEKRLGPGWSWDDYNSYYSAERTPFPIYGNLVNFSKEENGELQVFPTIFRDSLTKNKLISPRGIKRNSEANIFNYGELRESFSQNIPFHYSEPMLVKALEDTLKRKISFHKNPSEGINLDKTLYSIPADSVYKRMMEVSDNFIAEQILLMAAGVLEDSLKAGIAIDYMKENHLKDLPDEPIWVDGSGLSRYNLFTPRSMVKLLDKIQKEVPRSRLFSMLATGGVSGTLRNSYAGEPPYIFAKTGTLRHNHSLSGYLITNSGRMLIFSFMNNNYTVPTSDLKQEMEKVLQSIRDNY